MVVGSADDRSERSPGQVRPPKQEPRRNKRQLHSRRQYADDREGWRHDGEVVDLERDGKCGDQRGGDDAQNEHPVRRSASDAGEGADKCRGEDDGE